MDNKALFDLSYGLFVLTSNYNGKDNGCIVNTVQQVTDLPLRLSVTVNKKNFTHELILKSGVFNVSVLTTETPMKVFEHFGFQSGQNVDKFADCESEHRAINHVLYIPKYTNACIACRVASHIDLGTYSLFIADILDAKVLSDKPSVTYDYYAQHIKPKPDMHATGSDGKKKWVCKVCGWVYEGDELPDDIVCPLCKHGKANFEEIIDDQESDSPCPNKENTIIMHQIHLSDNIYYVGVNDRHTERFENHIELPEGVSYNSYLIADEKIALIDPVEIGFMGEWLHNIKSVIGTRKVDYLVINHDEPDHSGSLTALLKEYPDIQVVGNAKTFAPLEAFYGEIANKKIISDGETLCLGQHTLQFFMIPMVHWPESMVSYETTHHILFSNDAFGGFGTLNGGIFDDQVNIGFYEDEMRRYYANIVAKVAGPTLKAIERLCSIDIKMIAPSHGLIWRSHVEWVVGKYCQWSRQESEEGLVIVYGTMYGNTGRMAELVARGAADAGIKEIRIYDVSKTETSFIFSDIWKYKGLAIGSCSHYGNLYPNMTLLLHTINEFKPQNKSCALFGGMSWSGGGLKTLAKHAEEGKWNLVGENVEVKGAPIREQDENKLYELGKTLAAAIKAD